MREISVACSEHVVVKEFKSSVPEEIVNEVMTICNLPEHPKIVPFVGYFKKPSREVQRGK